MGKWEIVKLGDYITQIRGVSYKPEDASDLKGEDYFPLIRAHNIQPEGLNFDNLIFVKKEKIKDFQFLRKGDIAVCASSGSKDLVGKAAQATEDMNIAFGAFCKVVRPKEEINAIYLKHYFSSPKYRHLISKLSEGANINNLRNEHIDGLQIPLPPLEIQQKIADILDISSAALEKRRAQIDKLDLLVKAQFIEMFGDPVTNPKRWSIFKIKDLTTKIGSGATPKGGEDSYKSEGISLIRSMNVHNSRFKFEQLAYIDVEQAYQLRSVEVEENDILLNITGASVARSCIVPSEILPARVNQHVMIIRTGDQIMPAYLCNLLVNQTFKNRLLHIANAGGATRQALTKQQIEELLIPVPPISLQNQFASFVQQVEAQKSLLQTSLEKLEINHKSLMQKAFRGELF